MYWIQRGKCCVILRNNYFWYGMLEDVYLAQYSFKAVDKDEEEYNESAFKVKEEEYRIIPEEEYLKY